MKIEQTEYECLEDPALYRKRSLDSVFINEAYKGLELVILEKESIKVAQRKMIKQLGGRITNRTAHEVNATLLSIVDKFELDLSNSQMIVLESVIRQKHRKVEVETALVPYLKINIKLHKYNKDQLRTLKPSEAKYRPIQDSVSSKLKPYSWACMEVLRIINREFRVKFPLVAKIETKNGTEFSKLMNRIRLYEDYKAVMSTDFDDAYTNVTKHMLWSAIVKCSDQIDLSQGLIELALKLVALLLDNNYVEIADGVCQPLCKNLLTSPMSLSKN